MILPIDSSEIVLTVKPLAFYILTMSVYAVFIFKFYRFLGKKDIFVLNLKQYNTSEHWFINKVFAGVLYVLEYLVVMPVFIFFWFGILALLLLFLSKNQNLENVLLIAISVVGTVRVLSYYNEDLSRDIAKMLPLAILGVFLIDSSYFNLTTSLDQLKTITQHFLTLVYYLGFITLVEIFMRFLYIITYPFTKEDSKVEN